MGARSRWLALGALALAMLVVGLDATVLNVALPTIAGDLHASTSQLQWVASAYVLALAGAILPAGVLGDRFGRKKLMLIGLGIFLLGSIGGALTDSTGPLIAWRTAMGIGAAIITPIVMAMVPLLFNDEDRPKAVGIMTASISIGLPLGPIVGGYLLNHYHWSSIFWINVPFVVLALVAVTLLVQESRNPAAPALDYVGAVLSAAGIVTMVYGFVEAPDKGWISFQGFGFIVVGLVLVAAMLFWQTRAPSPLIDLNLFRNSRFVGGIVSMVLLTFVLYGLLFTLPSYLQAVRGNDAFGTGLRLLPMMIGLLIAGSGSKRLLTRVGSGIGVVTGMIIVSATMAALSFLSPTTNMWWIGLGLALFGLGLGMAMTSAMDAVLGALPREKAGSGSGVLNTMRQVSGALGVAVLGSILSSVYTGKLNDASLAQLPAPAAKAVKDSVVGAVSVARSMGGQGVSLQHMVGSAYTDAMSVLLIICAAGGVVAAAISGYIVRERAETNVAPTTTAAQEPLQL